MFSYKKLKKILLAACTGLLWKVAFVSVAYPSLQSSLARIGGARDSGLRQQWSG